MDVDLSTEYLGMKLRTPLVPSASPLSESLDNIKRMEDAGAAAIVLYSLFEEQLQADSYAIEQHLEGNTHSSSEAQTFFPEMPNLPNFRLGPEGYLNHIRRAKEAVKVPVIASLNGATIGGWIEYAKQIEEAGADALELNIYSIPTDPFLSGSQIERTYLEIVEEVRSEVTIPLAVKISPYFSNVANMAWRLEQAGADALVLFNRFYQPDIDLYELEVRPNILLSTPQALRLPLRWIAILYGRVHVDFAATGGVHEPADALKLLMAGANVTMLASCLLKRGIGHVRTLEEGLRRWMEEHEYESVEMMQGSMSQMKSADPSAFERAQYIRALQGYKFSKAGAK